MLNFSSENTKTWVKLFTISVVVIIGLLLSNTSWSAPIEGLVLRSSQGVFLRSSQATTQTIIKAANEEATEALSKLDTGDFISGDGVIADDGSAISITSIDYVGLKKILGLWLGEKDVVNFANFTDLEVYSPGFDSNLAQKHKADSPQEKQNGLQLDQQKANQSQASGEVSTKHLKYSISPSKGDSWTVFMTDNAATVLGNLQVQKNAATLTIFDPDNGATKLVLHLTKFISSRNLSK